MRMKINKIIFLIFITLITVFKVYSQSQKIKDKAIYNSIPQEKIFLHYNTSFLLSGETLYYKIYNRSVKNNQKSVLSKIAYVELIDKELNVVLKHKIWLDSGNGQGDFFIPVALNSGAYKIIAYTNWMKNGGGDNYFQGDIFIVNPYSINSETFFTNDKSNSDFSKKVILEENQQELISLKLSKSTFSNREKLSVDVLTNDIDIINGDYSISVRKVTEIEPKKNTAIDYDDLYLNDSLTKNVSQDDFIIPEFRGELIHGKVLSSSNEVISNTDVSLSIPGQNYILKVSKTDNQGNFYFIIDRRHNSNNAILQILNTNSEKNRIVLNENSPLNYKNLTFKKIELTENIKKSITQISINNQIENAYQYLKQDSLILIKNEKLFYGSETYKYTLNDFTRFKTLRETIVEILGELYYTEEENQYSIHFRKNNKFLTTKHPPMILVDGVLIQDHNDVIDFNARKINKIKLVREDYIYGTLFFNGLIDIETFKGDYNITQKLNNLKQVELPKIEPIKWYYQIDYQSKVNNLTRIPDLRDQLLWNPKLKLDENNSRITFYTSDLDGKYEINIEGFSREGKPISIKHYFLVK